jgi:hypothetical protein
MLVTAALLRRCPTLPARAAEPGEAESAAADAPHPARPRNVLVIPTEDCRDASLVLARVTRHIRNAERSARFSPEAEDDYDNGLQAIIETRCAEGIADLRAADRSLRASSEAQFSLPPAGAK